ncbi:MAG: hypothetical protein PHF37_05245 [Phycisphaerae bacterium]|nr:hypothetical protein [Phycisphaerae bacterium]
MGRNPPIRLRCWLALRRMAILVDSSASLRLTARLRVRNDNVMGFARSTHHRLSSWRKYNWWSAIIEKCLCPAKTTFTELMP